LISKSEGSLKYSKLRDSSAALGMTPDGRTITAQLFTHSKELVQPRAIAASLFFPPLPLGERAELAPHLMRG